MLRSDFCPSSKSLKYFTNRVCNFLSPCVHLWFQKWFQQQHRKYRWSLRRCEPRTKGTVHVLQEIWNQNSNTIIYEKCCSYLSISIFSGAYHSTTNLLFIWEGAIMEGRFPNFEMNISIAYFGGDIKVFKSLFF